MAGLALCSLLSALLISVGTVINANGTRNDTGSRLQPTPHPTPATVSLTLFAATVSSICAVVVVLLAVLCVALCRLRKQGLRFVRQRTRSSISMQRNPKYEHTTPGSSRSIPTVTTLESVCEQPEASGHAPTSATRSNNFPSDVPDVVPSMEDSNARVPPSLRSSAPTHLGSARRPRDPALAQDPDYVKPTARHGTQPTPRLSSQPSSASIATEDYYKSPRSIKRIRSPSGAPSPNHKVPAMPVHPTYSNMPSARSHTMHMDDIDDDIEYVNVEETVQEARAVNMQTVGYAAMSPQKRNPHLASQRPPARYPYHTK